MRAPGGLQSGQKDMSDSGGHRADWDTAVQIFRILVVCTANICRSPTAEHLLRDSLETGHDARAGIQFDVSSAGIRGWDGAPMDPPAAAELLRLGGDPSDFRARSFTPALAGTADLILTATTEHRRLVLHEMPQALRKTFTVLEFAHLVSAVQAVRDAAGSPTEVVRRAAAHRGAARIDSYDLADPYGHPVAVHRHTVEILHAATLAIAGALAVAPQSSGRLGQDKGWSPDT